MTDKATEYNRRYWLEHGAKWTLKARLAAAKSECEKLRTELEAEHELNHLAILKIKRLRAAHHHAHPKPGCKECEIFND